MTESKNIEELLKQYGSVRKVASALGVNPSTVSRRLKKFRNGDTNIKHETLNNNSDKVGKNLMEFRKLYDKSYIVPQKIKAALSKLKNNWEYENNFYRLAGVSLSDLGNFRDEFSDHLVVLKDRRIWAGTKETAQLLREMI